MERTPGEIVGRNIRALREALLLSRTDLAERSGISIAGIDHVEKGMSARPRRRTIEQIAGVLGVPPEDLLREPEERPRPKDEAPPLPLEGIEQRAEIRIALFERAADQWRRFSEERLYDLKRLDRNTLDAIDAVSKQIVIDHAEDARMLKAECSAARRESLEDAERQYFEAVSEFFRQVDSELEYSQRRAQMRELTEQIGA